MVNKVTIIQVIKESLPTVDGVPPTVNVKIEYDDVEIRIRWGGDPCISGGLSLSHTEWGTLRQGKGEAVLKKIYDICVSYLQQNDQLINGDTGNG